MKLGNRIGEMLGENEQGRIDYGIAFIDDATRGIFPGQFIIFGAATGVGKTEALTCVARAAARSKRVAFYALEAHRLEIEQRLFYKELSHLYFNSEPEERPRIPFNHFNYGDFNAGRYNKPLARFWDEAGDRLEAVIKNIDFIYPRNVTADTITLDIKSKLQDGYSLFIVDHLHYLEGDENELKAIRSHVKLFENVTHERKTSIIFASHLRKADRFRSDFPDKHELHGSSEISKRAHVVIMLGPAPKNTFLDIFETHEVPTIIHVDKFRIEGAITRHYGLHSFNPMSRTYSDVYVCLNTVYKDGKPVFEISRAAEKPFWALRGRTGEDLNASLARR